MAERIKNQAVSKSALDFQKLILGSESLGLTLSNRQLAQFRSYFEELEVWNQRVNLTSVKGLEKVQVRHFLDSLTLVLASKFGLSKSDRLLDLGSGAGFPSLPLKVVWPGLQLTLIESREKKTAFLQHVCAVLKLKNVEVETARAEESAHTLFREVFDTVVTRGVASMSTLAELTLPFCRIGGTAIAMKHVGVDNELAMAKPAISLMGGELQTVLPVTVEELGRDRTLVVIKKVNPTPEKYPRRPGVPAKRPL
jgi:16S rRNA (guanine527-N7)-methyltransferase